MPSCISLTRQKNYRVYCFPKHVGAAATQIREVFKGWANEICESQGLSKTELFGTPIEWDAFLYFEEEFSEYNSLCWFDGGREKSHVDGLVRLNLSINDSMPAIDHKRD